jgi:hypothetical protein
MGLIHGVARIFVHKRKDMTSEWRKILSERFHNMCSYACTLSLSWVKRKVSP